ncbi:MAG: NAD+ synthase [Nitriliruptor sp.]|nr:MAG: NAD+ synthase [Nitriliruptor sp.]
MTIRVALAQLGAQVGDIDGNVERLLAAWQAAADQGVELLVATELTITGYPPEDLLLKPEFVAANLAALDRLAAEGPTGCTAVLGYVGAGEGDATHAAHWDVALATRDLTNSAAVLRDGAVVATYDKLRLPNYGVFDEARYFTPRDLPCVVEVAGVRVGVTVCEDLWTEEGPVQAAARAGARLIANLNASPYHRGKRHDRERWARHHARRASAPVVYCNVVGGQDEVVFDGDSFVVDADGEVVARGAQFREDLVVVDLEVDRIDAQRVPDAPAGRPAITWRPTERLDELGEVWHALTRATRDYCHRNGFRQGIVGLSGGIDSAVVAALAADALGGENVVTVAMPSPYSSAGSLTDAAACAEALGTDHHVLAIGGPLAAVGEMLGDLVVTGFGRPDGRQPGVAYENLQSRLRGLTLMALSNETGAIVLTTGNKSEYAVGYATLYGDMSGGFAPIKDIPKLLVYELARWRNTDAEVIPEATITKPPSAELRPGQRDQDSLPDYEVLDDLVTGYVELDLSIAELVERGHEEAVVRRVVQLIDHAEFKRRQAAPGPKITARAFGRDRRVPISNGWRG